jgi:hypothetical protein
MSGKFASLPCLTIFGSSHLDLDPCLDPQTAYHLSTVHLLIYYHFEGPWVPFLFRTYRTPPGILQQQVLRTCWDGLKVMKKSHWSPPIPLTQDKHGQTTGKPWGFTWNLHGINHGIKSPKKCNKDWKGCFSQGRPAKIRSEPSASSRMHRSISISAMARHFSEVPTAPVSIFTKLNTSPNSAWLDWPLTVMGLKILSTWLKKD